jgi:hypothetical protein
MNNQINLAIRSSVRHTAFTFVPAQLVGAELKEAVIIPPLNSIHSKYYSPGIGETSTGMADSFSSFWYFGCVKFFLVAFAMGRLFFICDERQYADSNNLHAVGRTLHPGHNPFHK